MEELFRFLMTRPAQRMDATKIVPLRLSQSYGAQLRKALQSEQPRDAVRRVALAQRKADPLRSPADLALGARWPHFATALANTEHTKLRDLRALVLDSFDAEAEEVRAGEAFAHDLERLGDLVATSVVLGREGGLRIADAAVLLRAAAILERVADRDRALEGAGAVAEALERTLLLPEDVFPLPAPTEQGTDRRPPRETDDDDPTDALTAERDRLLNAYETLTRLTPEHLALPTAGDRAAPRPGAAALPPVPAAEPRDGDPDDLAPAHGGGSADVHTAGLPLHLKSTVWKALPAAVRDVLDERGLDLTRVGVPTAADRLSLELREPELRLARSLQLADTRMVKPGDTYLEPWAAAVGHLERGGMAAVTVPTTYGTVAPAGIGDLLTVRQNLKRYEAGELAHVENVLKGEFKERVHKRARTTEETVTVETETRREEERDQQSTERFELKTEASTVQKEDASLKVGLSLTGKYGPVVEFKASTDFSLEKSKEESTKVATGYSKDVTQRATSKIFERRREERVVKTVEVFEETNTHGIDNKAGDGPVVGQYQWVDKVYEAQVFNYGKRVLYDIMLPEPAAFLLHATTNAPKAGADLVKPAPFTLRPTDLSEWNYSLFVQQYQVVGVTAPPAPFVAVARALEGKGKEDDGATKAAEIPVPDGYQVLAAHVSVWFNAWSGGLVDVALGNNLHRFEDNDDWWAATADETGALPLALKTWKAEAFVVAVEIQCRRTERALEDWKLKTHGAILQAYLKLLRDYEDRLAALQVQAAQQFQGSNPAQNALLIRGEVKKGAIETFTAQHYDLFGAIALSPEGYPQPDLPEAAAEGRYIRFFEQAFEWEQMMFLFYPYFWGRKANWTRRLLIQDTDPDLADFLRAGAARVVVSVRPGFEQAVAHFLESGEVWDGGDLPPIASPLYVNIIEEIRERDRAPGAEVPQGEPWDVRVPTTLVVLRDEASLPSWRKDENGDWVPAD